MLAVKRRVSAAGARAPTHETQARSPHDRTPPGAPKCLRQECLAGGGRGTWGVSPQTAATTLAHRQAPPGYGGRPGEGYQQRLPWKAPSCVRLLTRVPASCRRPAGSLAPKTLCMSSIDVSSDTTTGAARPHLGRASRRGQGCCITIFHVGRRTCHDPFQWGQPAAYRSSERYTAHRAWPASQFIKSQHSTRTWPNPL